MVSVKLISVALGGGIFKRIVREPLKRENSRTSGGVLNKRKFNNGGDSAAVY